MKTIVVLSCFLLAAAGLAQQPPPPPLTVSLRCAGVETTPQSRAVKSAAYGFGNPTHPDDDEFTKHVDRIVLIEFHDGSGRIYLPKAVLAGIAHPIAEGWFPLERISSDTDLIRASLRVTGTGQSLRIDRRTGSAELIGYEPQTLKGSCRVDRKPQQF